jgi:hypothetical protein
MKYLIVALMLLVSVTARANGILPDAPVPVKHVVADREFWFYTAGVGVAWAMDTASTAQTFGRCPICKEGGYFFTGSRSVPKVMGAWAGVDIAFVVASYEWKKHVHNKYLHPLWRVFPAQRIVAHTEGAVGNWSIRY